MPACKPEPPPISKLHADILWLIFTLNGLVITYVKGNIGDVWCGMEKLRADASLIANRNASQVCRQWRNLIIASPSIWANSLDLQYLNQSGGQWRDEVLKRTGDAPLTVVGYLRHSNPYSNGFFMALLVDHWHRIRTLVVVSSFERIIEDKLRISSRRPAPNLEHFIYDINSTQLYTGTKIVPFSNNAPRLYSFSTSAFSLELSGSWSSNLRYLNLTWSQLDFTVRELLRGLEQMHLLENLCLQEVTEGPDICVCHETIPTITLPRLTSITIENCVWVVPDLIMHIITPPRCCLRIDKYLHEAVPTVDLKHTAMAYTTFFKNNFNSSDITDISFSIQVEVEELSDDEDHDNYSYFLAIRIGGSPEPGTRDLYVHRDSTLTGMTGMPFCMARAMSPCDLSNVTTLTLSLKTHDKNDILEHASIGDLIDLFNALQSVQQLHTDKETLQILMESEDLGTTSSILFPRLVTVVTDLWGEDIIEYLHLRRRICAPIKNIIFPENSPVRFEDVSVLKMACRLDITVGWEREAFKGVLSSDDDDDDDDDDSSNDPLESDS